MIKNHGVKRYIIYVLWLVFLFCVTWLPAAEPGRLSLTLQNQSFKTFNSGDDYFSSLNSIYLSLWQSLGKGSSFNFSINYYFDQHIGQVASYNLGLQQIPLGKFKLNVDFGTISYPLSSLAFFGSFNPTPFGGMKGGKITLTSYKTDIILFGGELYGSFGYQNGKSKIYGARTIFRPNPRWTVGTGYMKILDMPSFSFLKNGTADYDVFSLDSSVMTLKNLYLLGDFRYIYDQSSRNKDGFYAKTGTYYNSGKLSFEFFYNYISPNYHNLSSIFIQDHNGYTVMGQYKLFSWLSLFAGLDTFDESLRNDISQPIPGNFLTYRFGSTFSPKSLPLFSINYNESIKEFPGEETGNSSRDNNFRMLFLSLSKQHRRFFWSIYYNLGKFMRPGDSNGNYNLNRVFLNLRWFYLTGDYIYLIGSLDQRNNALAALDNKNYNVQVGANIRMASNLQFNIQGDYAVDKYVADPGDNRRFAIGGGIIYRFKPLKINCTLRYQYSKHEDSLGQRQSRYSHQAFVSINRDFYWGMKTSPALQGVHTGTKGSGKIKGSVFVDVNQNGLQEQEEQGLPDIYILVDNYQSARTDKNGRFSISSVHAGSHKISLDLRNIPAIYESGREKTEIVSQRKECILMNLNFPFGTEVGKNAPVLSKESMNIPHKIICVAV
ncbi:MAG: hypothetical protein MUF15_24820 [Acidobacteria bacterium]|nr:hypothetical protein [Acidobacteriota bacterium]